MKLLVDRKYKKQEYVISNLYVNDEWICNVIEDTDRGLKQSMTVQEIKQKKVRSKTAIPSGTYLITMNVISPKFKKYKFYYNNARMGRVPRILDVPGFEGILIHCGKTQFNSAGCLIVGYNTIKGKVTNSEECFIKLYSLLDEANKRGEKIEITIL